MNIIYTRFVFNIFRVFGHKRKMILYKYKWQLFQTNIPGNSQHLNKLVIAIKPILVKDLKLFYLTISQILYEKCNILLILTFVAMATDIALERVATNYK